MLSQLFWIEAPQAVRLAIVTRPRGGEGLEEDVAGWKEAGLDVVLSLLERSEIVELELQGYATTCAAAGLELISFPIPDRGLPASGREADGHVARIVDRLTEGKAVGIHCRASIGRSGMIASSVLVRLGLETSEAFARVSAARRVPVPDTPEQQRWVEDFARSRR
jgi:protein-tyrosine phosphatase